MLSIVVPVFNEEGNVGKLHKKLTDTLKKADQSFEIIFINDGSTDNSLKELKKLIPAKIINFRRNFGQTAAIDAGAKRAKGEIIITIDSDLQNDPGDIPKLLEKMDEGWEVVSGWRKNRKDPLSKRFFSKFADFVRQFMIKETIHDSGCSLKAYKKECFEDLELYGEMHRLIPALLRWKGFSITEVEVKHHPRKAGKSKYDWKRLIKGFVDVIGVWFWRKYSNRPLHLFGGMGVLLFGLALLTALMVIFDKFLFGKDMSESALTILAAVLFVTGILLFVAGLLADILIKSYYKSSGTKSYSIKEIIENRD